MKDDLDAWAAEQARHASGAGKMSVPPPVPTPVPSNPLIPPGVGPPALGGREPTATPPAVALEPRIETAPNGEQMLIYQTRNGRIKAERIHPVEPQPMQVCEPEFYLSRPEKNTIKRKFEAALLLAETEASVCSFVRENTGSSIRLCSLNFRASPKAQGPSQRYALANAVQTRE